VLEGAMQPLEVTYHEEADVCGRSAFQQSLDSVDKLL